MPFSLTTMALSPSPLLSSVSSSSSTIGYLCRHLLQVRAQAVVDQLLASQHIDPLLERSGIKGDEMLIQQFLIAGGDLCFDQAFEPRFCCRHRLGMDALALADGPGRKGATGSHKLPGRPLPLPGKPK